MRFIISEIDEKIVKSLRKAVGMTNTSIPHAEVAFC